jgi:DNA-binding transcriptional LysR family regulator
MLQRRVQFVLCHGHAGAPGRLDEAQYPVRRLSDDVLVPVCAADADDVALHALGTGRQPAMLAYSEASGLGRIMRAMHRGEFADNFAASLPVVFTAHHAALLRTLALEGRGLAWLPMSLVAEDLRSGALVDAGAGAWRVPVDIRLYRQQAQMAPVAEALWALVSEAGEANGSSTVPR